MLNWSVPVFNEECDDRANREHYKDPTAEKAIKRAMTFTYKVNLVKQIILLVCKLGGVRLTSDIELERRR